MGLTYKKFKELSDLLNAPLDDWLRLVFSDSPERPVLDFCFPTDRHAEEYILGIQSRSEQEVKALIRKFLIHTGSLGQDELLIKQYSSEANLFREHVERFEFCKRLLGSPTWEGMTWILDLLPAYPQEAINVVNAYFLAHIHFLPEGRMHSLSDVQKIIRARYLHQSHPQEVLLGLSGRDFEFLIASVYESQKYHVVVTSASRDGGYDVRACRDEAGAKETVLIECKLHARKLTEKEVRSFVAVIGTDKANRGVLFAPGGFTASSTKFAKRAGRIELVDYAGLNRLLNQTKGADWPRHIDQIIATQKSSNARR